MKIEEIPADEVVKMTANLSRLFKAGGCAPMCHACAEKIKVGDNFKLSTIVSAIRRGSMNYTDLSGREVMLCEKCTTDDLNKPEIEKIRIEQKRRAAGGGCFRVNGKIVI